MKPEIMLLQDPSISNWIYSWTIGQCKMMLGEAREKFSTIAGPGGGTTLNGTALKAEGAKMHEDLLLELKTYVDGSMPLTWVQG
jgi:hypothetical protein